MTTRSASRVHDSRHLFKDERGGGGQRTQQDERNERQRTSSGSSFSPRPHSCTLATLPRQDYGTTRHRLRLPTIPRRLRQRWFRVPPRPPLPPQVLLQVVDQLGRGRGRLGREQDLLDLGQGRLDRKAVRRRRHRHSRHRPSRRYRHCFART